MAESSNIFERRRDMLEAKIRSKMQAADEFFGVTERPYDSRKLTPEEQKAYFHAQPQARKAELWDQMTDAEKELIGPNG